MPFSELGLMAELLHTIGEQGYSTPTPIQEKSIPAVLQGKDVLAGAQTGTGKTAAFALPILQLLTERPRDTARNRKAPRALVLTPTRELAAQVHESFVDYGNKLPLRSAVIYGGVGFQPQKAALARGIEILVATPGRLLDHVGQGTLDLSKIEILVLDEADRMLDMGFIHDIRKVLKILPNQRQNLLFSATYSNDIRRLADGLLRDPELIDVAKRNTATHLVTQSVYRVEKGQKRALLTHLINDGQWFQVLVFTRTKHGANRLAQQLNQAGIEASAIHGNKSQGARTRALAGFKSGELRVLVATDIAARGLDIESLPFVVNYELPNVPEDYVHRIGRTGRAGETGAALSLVSNDEAKLLRDIQRVLKKEISVIPLPDFAKDTYSAAPQIDTGHTPRRNDGGGNGPGRNSGNRSGNRSGQGPGRGARASGPGASGNGQPGQRKRRPSRPGNADAIGNV
jgi:ATP-dependent RNA helicase RhlE